MPDRVHIVMDGMQPLVLEPILNRARSETEFEELTAGHHAVLGVRQASDSVIEAGGQIRADWPMFCPDVGCFRCHSRIEAARGRCWGRDRGFGVLAASALWHPLTVARKVSRVGANFVTIILQLPLGGGSLPSAEF